MAKAPEHSIVKMIPKESQALSYEFHDRAHEIYNQWMSGFTEEEIAEFHDLKVKDVKKDLMYVQTKLPVRQIIAHNNDRNRILVQREQSEDFRRLFGETLRMKAKDLIISGVSPAGILKEFREATGMIQKAEPLIQVNTQQNFIGGGSGGANGVASAEDAIRKILDKINSASPVNQLPENADSSDDAPVVEAEAREVDPENVIPDEED